MAKYLRRLNKWSKTDPESKVAFRDRSNIAKIQDIPHVDYYECLDGECSIVHLLSQHKKWYYSQSVTKWQVYFKQKSLQIFADREWFKAFENSSKNHHVLHLYIIYISFICHLHIIYILLTYIYIYKRLINDIAIHSLVIVIFIVLTI